MEIKGSSDCVEGERNEDSSHSKIDFRLESEESVRNVAAFKQI